MTTACVYVRNFAYRRLWFVYLYLTVGSVRGEENFVVNWFRSKVLVRPRLHYIHTVVSYNWTHQNLWIYVAQVSTCSVIVSYTWDAEAAAIYHSQKLCRETHKLL